MAGYYRHRTALSRISIRYSMRWISSTTTYIRTSSHIPYVSDLKHLTANLCSVVCTYTVTGVVDQTISTKVNSVQCTCFPHIVRTAGQIYQEIFRAGEFPGIQHREVYDWADRYRKNLDRWRNDEWCHSWYCFLPTIVIYLSSCWSKTLISSAISVNYMRSDIKNGCQCYSSCMMYESNPVNNFLEVYRLKISTCCVGELGRDTGKSGELLSIGKIPLETIQQRTDLIQMH